MKVKFIRYIRYPLAAMVFFALLAVLSERILLSDRNGVKSIQSFCDSFRQKQQKTSYILGEIAVKLDSIKSDSNVLVSQTLSYLNNFYEKDNISILVSENDQPVFWTDNVGCFLHEIHSSDEGLVQLPNGWYHHTRVISGKYTLDGLILIKFNYKIKNDYLKNRFASGFYFPRRFEILPSAEAGSYPVFDSSNQYAFSVRPTGTIPCKHSLLLIPGILYLLVFLNLLLIIYLANSHFMHHRARLKSILTLLILIGFYTLMNILKIPKSLYLTTLFSPEDFAFTSYWSSLGELLIFSFIFLFWSITFNRTFDLPDRIKKDRNKRRFALTGLLLFSALYFVFIRFMMYSLVMNSSLSFALFRIGDFTVASLYGYLAIGFFILSFLFLSVKIVKLFRKEISLKEYFVIVILISVVLLAILMVIDKTGAFRLNLFFLLISAISYFMNRKGVFFQRLLVTVIFVFTFSLFVLFDMIYFIDKHENEVQETIAINISAEHDPTAELLLKEIDEKIEADPELPDLYYQSVEQVENYLTKRYFGGYFREYDLQVTLCKENDSLVVKPENITQPCVFFFDNMVKENGTSIEGTHFYFMENTTGRITYFGRIECIGAGGQPINIFVELNSKLMSEGIGFPELLLPLNSVENKMKNDFSFAKYYNGELVDRGGKFNYALFSEDYRLKGENIFFNSWDGYEHCIYKYSANGFVIVSRQVTRIKDYLISFPYIFVFYFLIVLVFNYLSHPTFNLPKRKSSLKGKIQFSIVGIVFSTLLIVGSVTVFYIMSNYKNNYQNELIDKINSVSIELEQVVENTQFPFHYETEKLDYELTRISDVFQTDINLYDLSGCLVATSRPEVYEKGLISTMMNNRAFYELNSFHPSSFLQQEQIGDMDFLSAYVPVLDDDGQKTGYVNIPYFTHEKVFRQEITTFILAFINIYVFLLLTSILIAYFISSRITVPLRLIREHLQGVQFGKNPTPIRYRSDDELGILIAEYNRKVEELAESAELLARSERESAWREMARQIAHEIKNPLTPMKLNIQFLQRTDPKSVDNYEEILNRVSYTIIEQIDNLSAIATEFSNFAKMPRANNELFNLSQRLMEIISLFDYTGECEFETRFSGIEKEMVFADKEQFSRAIINLIKNSIQAIPDDRKGKIIIEIEKEFSTILIGVTDNGKGIPEELQERIFVPNFTTKTSGTGLGLAITKSIVENFGGEIWFSSIPDQGTTFFIRIPMPSNKLS